MTLYVSVNKHVLRDNRKNGSSDPPYEIRKSKDDRNPLRVNEAVFTGRVRMVFNSESPLISGAECWIEIDEE